MDDIIIIGGGAAGMAAAVGAADFFRQNGLQKRVTVLEKMPRPGRKIMITGKGRCNFTNMKDWNDFSGHIHPKSTLLKPAYFALSPAKTVEWFKAAGLDSIVERGDRVFPASYRSSDVVDTLQRALKQAGACLLTGYEADSISMRNDEEEGDYYMVRCSSGAIFTGRRLIIATGGLSYPSTGSTGDGYKWASGTGHKINRCFPSLTAIVPKSYKSVPQGSLTDETEDMLPGHIDRSVPLSETGSLLNGNSLENVSLTLWIDGNPVQEEFGDMDFTDGGIEGPIGFRISRKCVNAIINGSKVQVALDLKPAVEKASLETRISRLWKEIAEDRRSMNRQYRDRFRILLGKLMPAGLIRGFLKCNQSVDHKTLAKVLKCWKFDIAGYVGYERCVITAGGISSDSVTAKSLESKHCKGLYFAGEILDIDGDTGGFNLQIAFSTGMLAGQSAAKSLACKQIHKPEHNR